MTAAETALVRLAAGVATGRRSHLETSIDAARAHAEAGAAEEVILQSYLFAGFPAVIQAMTLWRERTGLTAGGQAAADASEWPARGETVCATIYAGQYERLRENVRALHPDLEQWMLVEGYGKVIGRPGLPLRVRELCIIATLGAQDAPRQLYSHMRGALNAGATRGDVAATLDAIENLLPDERVQAARATWQEVTMKKRAG